MTKLPDKLTRKAVRLNFTKLGPETWNYLFDHEKENGLRKCRTNGWGVKKAWYATKPLIKWLIDMGYYMPADFDPKSPTTDNNPWIGLVSRRHAISA